MIDLTKIEKIFLYPGSTDLRYGIFGSRKLVGDVEENSLYIFCGKCKNSIKILEVTNDSIWLYQKKLYRGKFAYPMTGDLSKISKKQLEFVINGISLINRIESKESTKNKQLF